MKWSLFNASWEGISSENRLLRLLVVVLSVALVVSVAGQALRRETVVVIPPDLQEKFEITGRSASAGYKKAWGLAIAELIGNLTPSNVDFVISSLGSMMTPELHEQFRVSAAYDAENIRKNGFSVDFTPKEIKYEPSTDKVFVVGRVEVSTLARMSEKRATPQSHDRTYEIIVAIHAGRPLVTHLASYQGAARTQALLDKERDREATRGPDPAKGSAP